MMSPSLKELLRFGLHNTSEKLSTSKIHVEDDDCMSQPQQDSRTCIYIYNIKPKSREKVIT